MTVSKRPSGFVVVLGIAFTVSSSSGQFISESSMLIGWNLNCENTSSLLNGREYKFALLAEVGWVKSELRYSFKC